MSIVTHGQALNITCEGYAGMKNFGFTGCHVSLPGLQRLALHAATALEELEAVFLPEPPRAISLAAPTAPTKAAAARKRAPGKARTPTAPVQVPLPVPVPVPVERTRARRVAA